MKGNYENAIGAKLWIYFALAIGWTWLFLIPATPLSRDRTTGLVIVLRILAGIGPAIAAIFLLYIKHERRERRDYWRRVIEFGRIAPAWLGVTLLTVPVITALAAMIDHLLGGRGALPRPAAGDNSFCPLHFAVLPASRGARLAWLCPG